MERTPSGSLGLWYASVSATLNKLTAQVSFLIDRRPPELSWCASGALSVSPVSALGEGSVSLHLASCDLVCPLSFSSLAMCPFSVVHLAHEHYHFGVLRSIPANHPIQLQLSRGRWHLSVKKSKFIHTDSPKIPVQDHLPHSLGVSCAFYHLDHSLG